MTTVLKLGGSVITEKSNPETLDEANLERAAEAIAGSEPEELVVVHGGGSFGHPAAAAHGVTVVDGTTDAAAIGEIHDAMTELNGAVRAALLDQEIPAVAVAPLAAGARDRSGTLSLAAESVETMLGEGFVPVVQGDVVAHAGRGATVVSGDELVVSLARRLGADRVGLCSTVSGVLDESGEVVPRLDSLSAVESVLGGSESTDVTGGMAGKVERLLALETPASIFAVDALADFLAGETVGTTVD